MKTKKFFYLAIFVSMMITIACGTKEQDNARSDDKDETRNVEQIAKKSEEFAQEAASINMMEVQISDIAINRSQNAEIDQLAGKIKAGHENALSGLRGLANTRNWALPVTMLEKHQNDVDKFSGTEDGSLDELYLNMMVDSHKSTIDKFEKCSEADYDPQLAAWAQNSLPVLRAHLDDSQALLNRTADKLN